METLDIIAQLETLLVDERTAIAKLEGAKVDAIASEKKKLAEALERRPASERKQAGKELEQLVRNLKNNGVLLAHAKGILSDLLRGRGTTLQVARGAATALRPLLSSAARHLSVRG